MLNMAGSIFKTLSQKLANEAEDRMKHIQKMVQDMDVDNVLTNGMQHNPKDIMGDNMFPNPMLHRKESKLNSKTETSDPIVDARYVDNDSVKEKNYKKPSIRPKKVYQLNKCGSDNDGTESDTSWKEKVIEDYSNLTARQILVDCNSKYLVKVGGWDVTLAVSYG